eukprot:16263501-Heterocapsa_arctica.AAC.1
MYNSHKARSVTHFMSPTKSLHHVKIITVWARSITALRHLLSHVKHSFAQFTSAQADFVSSRGKCAFVRGHTQATKTSRYQCP